MIVGGFGMVASFATNKSKVTLADVTPVARLTSEYSVVVVPKKSPIKSLEDLIEQAEAERRARCPGPAAPPAATTTCSPARSCRRSGVDPQQVNYIAFSGGGDSLASIIGGQVTVGVGGYSELDRADQGRQPCARSAISAATRVPGVDIPTLSEQGVDATLSNWRGVAAPPRPHAASSGRPISTLIDKVVKSPSWKDAAEEQRLERRVSRRRRLQDATSRRRPSA